MDVIKQPLQLFFLLNKVYKRPKIRLLGFRVKIIGQSFVFSFPFKTAWSIAHCRLVCYLPQLYLQIACLTYIHGNTCCITILLKSNLTKTIFFSVCVSYCVMILLLRLPSKCWKILIRSVNILINIKYKPVTVCCYVHRCSGESGCVMYIQVLKNIYCAHWDTKGLIKLYGRISHYGIWIFRTDICRSKGFIVKYSVGYYVIIIIQRVHSTYMRPTVGPRPTIMTGFNFQFPHRPSLVWEHHTHQQIALQSCVGFLTMIFFTEELNLKLKVAHKVKKIQRCKHGFELNTLLGRRQVNHYATMTF